MKLTINTAKLQEMLMRATKGVGNNKLIPLTSLIAIELRNNKLTLITTDATNYLYVSQDKVEGDDFYVVVQVETFAKLIARMTCENVTLELLTNTLKVSGNGNYNIELPLDENGELIKYPDPLANFDASLANGTINLSTAKVILNTVKPALAVTMEAPCYTGYYAGVKVVATDTYKICGLNVNLFNEPVLISPEMMDLLDVMTEEKIAFQISDDTIIFTTNDCQIYGKKLDGIEDYQIEAIEGLLGKEFNSMCKIPKSALLQLLDRLSLFVGTYDKNGVYLTFTKDGLMVSSKASSGTEIIQYQDSKNFQDFTCCIDIEMLRTQVKAQASDMIEMYYGLPNAIKMVDGNVTQIVALLEDDRMAE
jgi:DNA polymerase III sliding clamp (beta) subunit (PCNA family)